MRKALGKGLDALFPGAAGAVSMSAPTTHLVAPAEIDPSPEQPRRIFTEEGLAALTESIRRHGLLQPLVVRRAGGRYELIAGERRLRAAQRAGLESVPVIVREAGRAERLELALIENLQREDLTPLEAAEAFRHLIDMYGFTQEQVAERVGKSRSAIANGLRLLSLPEAVKAQLETGEMSAGHARAVLSVTGAAAQLEVAREIASQKLSVRGAERAAGSRRARAHRPRNVGRADVHLSAVADELTRDLGTRVRVLRRARGGVIEIEFYSEPELNRLIDRLRSTASAGQQL